MKPYSQRHACVQDNGEGSVCKRKHSKNGGRVREGGGDRKWNHTQFCLTLLIYASLC